MAGNSVADRPDVRTGEAPVPRRAGRQRSIAVEICCEQSERALVAWVLREVEPGDTVRIIRVVTLSPRDASGPDAAGTLHDPRMVNAQRALSHLAGAIRDRRHDIVVEGDIVAGPRNPALRQAAEGCDLLVVCGLPTCRAYRSRLELLRTIGSSVLVVQDPDPASARDPSSILVQAGDPWPEPADHGAVLVVPITGEAGDPMLAAAIEWSGPAVLAVPCGARTDHSERLTAFHSTPFALPGGALAAQEVSPCMSVTS